MTRSRKGSGFGGMRLARCPRCSFVFRKSAQQIASGVLGYAIANTLFESTNKEPPRA